MGRWSGAAKRASSSIFVALENGVATRLRILDDPYAQNRSYRQPSGEVGDPRTVFSWPVYDYETKTIRILSKGASVLKQLDSIMDAWHVDEMPMPCDIVITSTGKGLQTRYDVQGVPITEQLPDDWMKHMPDMDKHIANGVPVQQYADGYKLKAVVTGDKSDDGDGEMPVNPPGDLGSQPLEPPEDLEEAV